MTPASVTKADAASSASGRRLQRYLSVYQGIFPTAWSDIEHFRRLKGSKEIGTWPASVLLPMAGSAATVNYQAEREGISDNPVWQSPAPVQYAIVAALGAWRLGKVICRFEPARLGPLWQTPVTGRLTVADFERLPEYAVFIEAPAGATYLGQPLLGAFAHLEWDVEDQHMELRLVLDLGDVHTLTPVFLHLGYDLMAGLLENAHDYSPLLRKFAEQAFAHWAPTAAPFVSCLLHLCRVAPPQIRAEEPVAQPTLWTIA